jgi:branched-chain amino acid transport system substrate-binding protein
MGERHEKHRFALRVCFAGLAGALIFVFLLRTAAAAGPKPVVKFGVCTTTKFPLTKHQWTGAQLAAEEINAAGGVKISGVMHELELIKAESNELSSVTDAANAMEKLLTVDKVAAVTGGFRGEAVMALMELMADHKVPLLISGSGTVETSEKVAANYDRYKYYFRTVPVNVVYMTKVQFAVVALTAEKIREELGVKTPKVALLMEKAMWTERMTKAAEALLPQMGMEVIGVWQPSPNATDVTAELTAIKAAGAQLIFLGVTGPVGAVIARQWGELQIPAALAGTDAFGNWGEYWKSTGGMCAYEVTYGHYASEAAMTPKSVPFMEKYIKRFGEMPVWLSGAYDTLFIWKEAVERAGSLNGDAVVAELEKTDYQATYGRVVFHPKGHQWVHDVIWAPGYVTGVGFQWLDGKQICVWPDGKPLHPGISPDPGWKDVKYKGTKEVQLPPWMLQYWKGKK